MNSLKIAIVIPARYNSSRFPGKPLTMLSGKTMLARVCEVATKSIADIDNAKVIVERNFSVQNRQWL